MEKRCFSVKNPEFEKSIKSLGKVKIERLYERIAKLEAMENDPSTIPNGVRNPETLYGKTLSRMGNKNIYVMELGDDRAMAVVIEKEGKKIYAWFWGGSHEDYNKKLNAQALHKVESNITKIQLPEINEKIAEIKKLSKTEVGGRIKGMKDKYLEVKPQDDKSYKI